MNFEKIGHDFTQGCIGYLVRLAAIFLLITTVIYFCIQITGSMTDDSDDGAWNRSGLAIYTDHLTGVQYVGNANGLCIRIDKDGKPIISDD